MYSVRDKKCGHSPIVKRDIIATIISKIDRPKKNPSSTSERVQRALQSDILNENKRGHETGHHSDQPTNEIYGPTSRLQEVKRSQTGFSGR